MLTAESEESISPTDFTLKMSSHQSSNFSCQLQENHKTNEQSVEELKILHSMSLSKIPNHKFNVILSIFKYFLWDCTPYKNNLNFIPNTHKEKLIFPFSKKH